MGFFIREKKDGRRGAGYGVYLIAGMVSFAGIVFLRHRIVSGSAPVRPRRSAVSKVAAITEPASMIARVDVKDSKPTGTEARSYRLEPPPAPAQPSRGESVPAEHETFATINLALQAAGTSNPAASPGQPLDEFGGQRGGTGSPITYAPLPPAFVDEKARGSAGSASEALSRGIQLLGYRDPGEEEPLRASSASGAPAATPKFFAPKGTLIRAFLLTTVDTGNPAAVLQFGAARALVFNHTYQLPFGTRFLGKISGQPARDRVNLAVDTILYPDGLELPVAATAVEADDAGSNIHPGIEAYYFPPPQWAQVSPYVADFITGYMSLLQSRAEQPVTASVGGVSIQTANSTDPRPPLYQASAQAIQAFTQARLKDIEQRYATYYLIPAGTACWLELERDLDLSRAHQKRRLVTPDFGANAK